VKRATALKVRNRALVACAAGLVIAVNAQQAAVGADALRTMWEESRPEYMATHGSWETVELDPEVQLNAIHSALLPTGKVLLVAGSGNNTHHFAAGTFDTVLWDPATDVYKKIDTPEDLFCGGHAFLPDGNLLIAGGTRKYEVLADEVTHAAGVVTLVNDAIYEQDTEVAEGAIFVDEATGLRYRVTETKTVAPVTKLENGGKEPTETKFWVEAVEEGEEYVFEGEGHQLRLEGREMAGLYGQADTISLAKQEYHGLDSAYIFDVHTESYRPVDDMTKARWYPTLVSTEGDDILAVSGLDEYGVFIDHGMGTTELFDVETGTWTARPDLDRAFPTYPALFRALDGSMLYSGSNAGYGPSDQMRTPGIWDLTDNSFEEISGLRDPGMTETSSSVLLPPAQDQKVLIAGGGSVGDAEGSTDRVDVIDFGAKTITPAPDLQEAARYVSSVILPTDEVLLTGGSGDYRGRGDSDVHAASLYDAATGEMTEAASPHVGRNYHSEALLLPDGRVMTMGSDPLYGDAENESAGSFEQRVEIYSPPYLFTPGERPVIGVTPTELEPGTTVEVPVTGDVATARLVRPSAVTHMTDTEQRSVELGVEATDGGVRLTVPAAENLTPSGWYMLFVVDENGKPSVGRWVHVP